MEKVDLRDYGVILLTGESCKLSLRILTDYTIKGKALLEDFFGTKLVTQEAWNSQTNSQKHIGSIMLSRACLRDLQVFAALTTYPVAMVTKSGEVTAMEDGEKEELFKYGEDFEWVRQSHFYHNPTPGQSRNVHQMSGRVV